MVFRLPLLGIVASAILVAQSNAPAGQNTQSSTEEASPETPALVACPAGAPIGAVDLRVLPPNHRDPLPFQMINHLSEGDTVLYAPILRGREKRPGEIALVMVPVKREPKDPALLVTEPKPANKTQQWKIERPISLAALVYGPQGLSKKKVEGFLSQDDLLIAQLADYAEKTAQTEALVEALSNNGSSSASMNAALTGFASQYGLAVQLDKNSPPGVQAQTLFATMNPQLATYNPLGSSTAERIGQTASLATAAATLFFGSPIGLAAGGTAMLLDLRYIAFPGTQFRSSFAQTLPTKTGLNLCGQRTPAPPHTRIAFIWAVRIPNSPVPVVRVEKASYLPQKQKTPVPVEVPDPQWKYLQRARDWTLESAEGKKFAVPVLKLGNQKALEVNLTKSDIPAGEYHLTGFWDWKHFEASGPVHVAPLSTFADAKMEPASQNNVLAKTGKVPVTLTGADYEFLTKVEIKKQNDEFAVAEPARFVLPKGLREGPQDTADVQIDTTNLSAGKYELLLQQQDGKPHPVTFNVLTSLPHIENLPIRINQGVSTQHYVLKGARLNLISQLKAAGADFELGPPLIEAERNVTIRMSAAAKPGNLEPIEVGLTDRSAPMMLNGALEITGPLPMIASSRLSVPANIGIVLQPDVFPAGYNLAAMLDVRNVDVKSQLRIGCSEEIGTPLVLHIGEETAASSLQQLSPDQLFVSFDTSGFPAGCELQATLDNSKTGRSQPYTLAKLIRVPKIDTLISDAAPGNDGKRAYNLTGLSLEMIEKVGWDALQGVPVVALPAPIPGQGQRQTLEVNLPDPVPTHPALYVWLRGEKNASATNVTPTVTKSTDATAPPLALYRTLTRKNERQ